MPASGIANEIRRAEARGERKVFMAFLLGQVSVGWI
jgi:hypothetical protein